MGYDAPKVDFNTPSAYDAIEELTCEGIVKLCQVKSSDKISREICHYVLAVIYWEKRKNDFADFKNRFEIKESEQKGLIEMCQERRPPSKWQMDMLEGLMKISWFNYINIKMENKTAALLAVVLMDVHQKGLDRREKFRLKQLAEKQKKEQENDKFVVTKESVA